MTRDGTRPLAALIAILLAAALLTACGGSSSDSTGSTDAGSTGSTATDTTAQSNPQDNRSGKSDSQEERSGQDQHGGQHNQGGPSQAQQDSAGSTPKNVATPLKVSGGGSEQFRSKGADNSIQEYGDEGDESELQEAAEVVHGFYVARAQEEWDKACSYLAKSNIEQLEELGSKSPQFKAGGCAPILEAFTRPLPAAIQREITTVDAGSLRRDGEQGFLIYYGPERTIYAMPLLDEDGSWRVAALSGTTLD